MRNRWQLLLLFLLLTIPLSLLLWDIVPDVLLPAFWRLLWGLRTLSESLPQVPIWDLLVAVLVVLAATSLMRRRRRHREEVVKEIEYLGRVQTLTRSIQQASQGEYFRWSLAHSLGELALEVMAYREHATAEQVRQRLAEGRLDLPSEIQVYLQSGQSPRFTASGGLLFKLRERWKRAAPSPALDPAMLEAIQFLEDQLGLKP